MAKATPEGKVKKQVLALIERIDCETFHYMPVQNGMGQTGIPDIMLLANGATIAIETKATSKQHPTILQALTLQKIHKAGGLAWVIDADNILLLEELFFNFKKDVWGIDRKEVDDLYNAEQLASLYRWRDKLEPMEFDNE